MRSMWTFPTAVKSSDWMLSDDVLGGYPQIGFPFAKDDAVAHAVDAAAQAVGREARVVVIEAPRLGRDVIVQHVAAAQVDRSLARAEAAEVRHLRRARSRRQRRFRERDRRQGRAVCARSLSNAHRATPKRSGGDVPCGSNSEHVKHGEKQRDRGRTDSREERRNATADPSRHDRSPSQAGCALCHRPSGAMMPLMPVAAARTT